MSVNASHDEGFAQQPAAGVDRHRPPLTAVDAAVWVAACAWCGRVRVGGRWLVERQAMSELRRSGLDTAPSFTHTICPSCFESVMQATRRTAA
jgi:hypothetical protein